MRLLTWQWLRPALHQRLRSIQKYKTLCFHTQVTKMAEQEGAMWSFGFGSNMDRIALETKKHVKILEEACAVLKDWKFSYIGGVPFAEPAYANVEPSPGDEVHGLAFLMTADSLAELDRTESGYNKSMVELEAYDGRKLKGFVYTGTPNPNVRPTKRYMGVLIKGATQAGLKPEYIQKLRDRPTYVPNEETLAKRKALPAPESLAQVTVEELAKHDGSNKEKYPTRVGVLGYVFEIKKFGWFGSHKGRDTTTRFLNQYHGIPMDDNDDKGRPPYPILDQLSKDEVEYVSCWMDHYIEAGPCVGYLKEFLEQQKSGKSDWKLPSK